MDSNLIEELYNIINNEDGNLLEKYYDKFKIFYDDRASAMIKMNDDIRIYTVFEYILEHCNNTFFEYEISNLLEVYDMFSLCRATFDPFLSNTKKDNDIVSDVFLSYIHYLKIRNILIDKKNNNELNDIELDSINKMISPNKIRDFSSSCIQLLGYGFFNIDINIIDELLKFIKNNDYVDELCNKKLDLLDKNYIYNYLTKYIFIKDFCSIQDISEDKLVNAIIKGKINDDKIYKYFFENVDLKSILGIYNNNLKELVDDINNNTSITHDDKFTIKDYLCRKLISSKPNYLVDYLNDNPDNELSNFALINIGSLIRNIKNMDIEKLSNNSIMYCLIHDLSDVFKINFCNYYKDKEVPDEFKPILNNISKNFSDRKIYTNDELVNTINKLVLNREKLSKMEVINIADTIFSMCANSPKNIRAMSTNDNTRGYYNDGNIYIDIEYYSTFLPFDNSSNYKSNIELLLKLINSVFHEYIHYEQFNVDDISQIDKEFMKERLIRLAYPNYYDNNYKYISYERDARIKSYELSLEFINKYFPHLSDIYINLYSENYKIDLELDINNKTLFDQERKIELDRIFDRLVFFHPEIKENYPYLFEEQKTL